MEAIRKIVPASMLVPLFDLPWKSKNQQVEMIIMPIVDESPSTRSTGKSLKGSLKAYADPALIEKENSVWENLTVEKYGTL